MTTVKSAGRPQEKVKDNFDDVTKWTPEVDEEEAPGEYGVYTSMGHVFAHVAFAHY